MYLSNKSWLRLQDNIEAIIFLGIFQAWMTIMFPGHAFLGATANIIMQVLYGIIGMISLVWVFLLSDNIENVLFSNESWNLEEPIKSYAKWSRIIIFILTFGFSTYFGYNKGFFNYSKLYYVMFYVNWLFVYHFLYKAVRKRKQERQC